jgi:regulatory protein
VVFLIRTVDFMDNSQNVITALTADPMNPDKVHVFIDGKHALAVSLDVAAAERLTVGQACPPERIRRLESAQEEAQVYEFALNFLSYRPRSAREVEQRLRKKGITPEQIAAVMERLRKKGYVDDQAFARFWIGNRQTFSPRGPRLLRSELRQKGVPLDLVDAALSAYQEEQAEREEQSAQVAFDAGITDDEPAPGSDEATALALARKRMRVLSNLDPVTAKRRLSSFLARRGYGYDTIGPVLQRVLAPDEDEETDMDDM